MIKQKNKLFLWNLIYFFKIFLRYCAVYDMFVKPKSCSGVPVAITSPPAFPPSLPISIM